MIKITDFVKYYQRNYQSYFDGTTMLEYEEDVLRAVINQTFEMIREGQIAEIQECVALNIRQYFQDSYIESSDIDPDEAENDSYDFFYQYNIIDELYKVLKDTHFLLTESNNIPIVWSEDTSIDFLAVDDDIYLTFENSNIVKYTDVYDLYNSKQKSTKGFNKIIDLSNEFILFKNIVGENHNAIFFQLLENYLYLKEKSVDNLYKEYIDIIPITYNGQYRHNYVTMTKEEIEMIFKLFNQDKINKIKFNGWIRNTVKIRSTNFV